MLNALKRLIKRFVEHQENRVTRQDRLDWELAKSSGRTLDVLPAGMEAEFDFQTGRWSEPRSIDTATNENPDA